MKLGDIASITTGYQSRGKKSAIDEKNYMVYRLNIKDLSRFGGDKWSHLTQANVVVRSPYYLQDYDVLFTHKTWPCRAYPIINIPGQTMATNQMLIIRPHENNGGLSSEFIAWQLNQQPCKQYFEDWMRGDNKKHLTADSLKATPIVMPNIELQRQVVSLHFKMQKEISTYHQMIQNREQYLKGISKDFFRYLEEGAA